jgi:hypothetical protein
MTTLTPLERLTSQERKAIKEAASQTRFTWVVLLLTFATVLVGLLSLAKPISGCLAEEIFSSALIVIYFFLSVGVAYSFYAICRTTYIIDILTRYQWSKAVEDFLTSQWGVFYTGFVKKDGKFRKRYVEGWSVFIWIIWMLLLFGRLFIFS